MQCPNKNGWIVGDSIWTHRHICSEFTIFYGPLRKVFDEILSVLEIPDLFGHKLEIVIVHLHEGVHASLVLNVPASVKEIKLIMLHGNTLRIRASSFGFNKREEAIMCLAFLNVCLREDVINRKTLMNIRTMCDNEAFIGMNMLERMVNWFHSTLE
jgi:hypothetical protein